VRGELVAALETDRPGAVFRPGRVLELGDAAGRPTGERITLERSRPFKDGILIRLAEFASRTPELEALRGRTLLIPAEEAAPAAEDEIHFRDLVGMAVLDGAERVGAVTRVLETAAGELIVVERGAAGELFVPFVAEWLRGIDRERGEIRFELPAGLREL
jgi:16S rRNA processing protein RimM